MIVFVRVFVCYYFKIIRHGKSGTSVEMMNVRSTRGVRCYGSKRRHSMARTAWRYMYRGLLLGDHNYMYMIMACSSHAGLLLHVVVNTMV